MHVQGVMSARWCTQDPGMLLSSGKDGRTILWDVSMQQNLPLGQPLGEFSAGFGEYVHDLAWSPSNPGVFATASLGGGENHNGVVFYHNLAEQAMQMDICLSVWHLLLYTAAPMLCLCRGFGCCYLSSSMGGRWDRVCG